jgi:hypothetical protein
MYRNKAILDAVRDISICSGCGKHNDGTIVAAHSNHLRHGKGRGIKAHDCFIAALCYDCHSELDQGTSMSRDEREDFWRQAHDATILWLFLSGRINVK